MTARLQNGFLLSTALHVSVVVVALLLSYAVRENQRPQERILELVAGAGDNFGATVAPAIGTPGGIKLSIPKPTPPKVETISPPPEPVAVEPAPPKVEPVKAAPPPPTTKQATKAPTRSIARDLQTKLWRAEARAKEAVAKDRAAEAARLAKEEKLKSQLKHIDAEGIAKGVAGGSTDNKIGGAGGKALTTSGGTEMEMYFAMLKARLLDAWERPAGTADTLVAGAEFRIGSDGRISNVRIIRRSGSPEFDRAVIEAFARVEMPKRPDGKSDINTIEFHGSDK